MKRYDKSGAGTWIYVGKAPCIGERMGTVEVPRGLVGSPSEAPSREVRIKIFGAYDPNDYLKKVRKK